MAEAKHTPGPWWFMSERGNGLYSGHHIEGAAVFVLAPSAALAQEYEDNNVFVLPSVADQKLIAAAPEMLAALEHAVRYFDQLTPSDAARYRIAIAKATGDQQ